MLVILSKDIWVNFGQNTGYANINGSGNSFFGTDAGRYNGTGGSNSFFGKNAGFGITTGGNNSFFGETAGRWLSNFSIAETNSNSVAIGSNTRLLSNGGQNEIVIGYNTTGLGSNTSVLGNSSTTTFAVWGDLRLMKGMATAPASSTSTCVAGEIRITADYIHVCTSTNVWKRAALTGY